MRRVTILLLSMLLAAGCDSRSTASTNDILLDRIEAQVRLPPTARPLHEYERIYRREGGRIYALYLASDEASNVNGALVSADGGWSAA